MRSELTQPAKDSSSFGRSSLIDLLRIFAALAVLCFHWFGQINTQQYIFSGTNYVDGGLFPRISAYGEMGVDLFFIISGAVISRSALGKNIGEFLFARIKRVYPAFFFAILLSFIITRSYSQALGHSGLSMLPGNFLMLGNVVHVPWIDGVFWTLECEWKFYLGIALALWFYKSKGSLTKERLNQFAYFWLAITTILLAVPGNFLLGWIFQPQVSPLFIAGILLATGTERSDWMQKVVPYGICMVESATWRFQNESSLLDSAVHRTYPYIAYLVIVSLYIFMALLFSNKKLMSKRNAFATRLGLLSYPIYLTHGTPGLSLLHWMSTKRWGHLQAYLLSGLVVLATSSFIAFYIEPKVRSILVKIAKK